MLSASYHSFGLRWLHQLVSLHHATVGEAAVIFIRIASPGEQVVAPSASA